MSGKTERVRRREMPREFETGLSGAVSLERSLWSGLSGAVSLERSLGRREWGEKNEEARDALLSSRAG
jgi:hypothetical protein